MSDPQLSKPPNGLSHSLRPCVRTTWLLIAVALLTVAASSVFIGKRFVQHVFTECHGRLVAIPTDEVPTTSTSEPRNRITDLEVRYDTVEDNKTGLLRGDRYTNIRVVWNRADGCACEDVVIPHVSGAPWSLHVHHYEGTDVYVVRETSALYETADVLVAFRKVEGASRKLDRAKLMDGSNASMLVLFVAMIALLIAVARAIRATPYALRMQGWHEAVLRNDGVVESMTGATLGRMVDRARVPAGDVIINPSAYEGRDVYREMPILTRRVVGAGSHDRWREGTLRQLRDARVIAVISGVTTLLALTARLLG